MLFNGYSPTYQPGGMDQSQSPLQSPQLASPGAAPPNFMQSAFSQNMPGANQPMPSSGSPLGFNNTPQGTSPWANPGPSVASWGSTSSNNPLLNVTSSGALGQIFPGQQTNSTYANYDYQWQNPFQPVQNYMQQAQGGWFNYGMPQGSMPGGQAAPMPGAGGPMAAHGGPQTPSVQSGLSAMQAPFYQGTIPGANGVANPSSSQMMNPYQAQTLFNAATPQNLMNINPYALQNAFGQASQNYANAFANQNYMGGGTNPTVQGNGSQTIGGAQSALNSAYNSYLGAMNKDHLF